jgi:hypothetical protein
VLNFRKEFEVALYGLSENEHYRGWNGVIHIDKLAAKDPRLSSGKVDRSSINWLYYSIWVQLLSDQFGFS